MAWARVQPVGVNAVQSTGEGFLRARQKAAVVSSNGNVGARFIHATFFGELFTASSAKKLYAKRLIVIIRLDYVWSQQVSSTSPEKRAKVFRGIFCTQLPVRWHGFHERKNNKPLCSLELLVAVSLPYHSLPHEKSTLELCIPFDASDAYRLKAKKKRVYIFTILWIQMYILFASCDAWLV